MGLDNGVIIKGKTKKGKEFLLDEFKHLQEDYEPEDFEFVYWRKCWNMRTKFLEVFKNKGYDGNGGEVSLTIGDLHTLTEKVLKYFLIEENWEKDDKSFWEWHTMIRSIALSIDDLYEFFEATEELGLTDEDFEVYFYDSY